MNELLTSETDERLLRANLLECYGTKTLAFRVSKEHYRYLAEQIIALREHLRRHQFHITRKRNNAAVEDVATGVP